MRQLDRRHVVVVAVPVVEGDHEAAAHVLPATEPVEQLPERDHSEVLGEEVAVGTEFLRGAAGEAVL